MTQLSNENSECVQPLVVSWSESLDILDRRSSVSSCRSSREDMIGPMSSVSSSIQLCMMGNTMVRDDSMASLLELASVPVGARVVVGVKTMLEETSPPLMTGSTVVVPSISVVILVTPGGLVTAPGTRLVEDEVVIPVPRGTELELVVLMPVPRGIEEDDEELLDELEEDELVDVVAPVPRGMLIEDEDELLEGSLLVDVELMVVLLVYGPLPVEGSVPVPTEAWPAARRAKEKSNERAMKEDFAMSTIGLWQRKARIKLGN